MAKLTLRGSFSVAALDSPAAGYVLQSCNGERVLISGYHGAPLPRVVTDPSMIAAGGAARWSLTCAEGGFDFEARAIEHQAPLPGLFDASLAPYALRPRERIAARWLLRLLRWRGSARLLRAWHTRRR